MTILLFYQVKREDLEGLAEDLVGDLAGDSEEDLVEDLEILVEGLEMALENQCKFIFSVLRIVPMLHVLLCVCVMCACVCI